MAKLNVPYTRRSRWDILRRHQLLDELNDSGYSFIVSMRISTFYEAVNLVWRAVS